MNKNQIEKIVSRLSAGIISNSDIETIKNIPEYFGQIKTEGYKLGYGDRQSEAYAFRNYWKIKYEALQKRYDALERAIKTQCSHVMFPACGTCLHHDSFKHAIKIAKVTIVEIGNLTLKGSQRRSANMWFLWCLLHLGMGAITGALWRVYRNEDNDAALAVFGMLWPIFIIVPLATIISERIEIRQKIRKANLKAELERIYDKYNEN